MKNEMEQARCVVDLGPDLAVRAPFAAGFAFPRRSKPRQLCQDDSDIRVYIG